MKKTKLLATLFGMLASACLHAQPPVTDTNMDAFIDHLMGRMTLEEKIGQMNYLDVSGAETSTRVATEIRQGLAGGVKARPRRRP